ncbi:glycosyltransferase family 1 protein [Streptomyces sp. 8K308]|uniref:glycosyltransferase family 4 protein n=1 Tax=Streptomyces sp. 8K308 TaxID=2530388 RepID=UPI00104346C2|nr:glycosyltransferase family 4 protein [Streptomyces sp. 8K308]TDC11351.1 glycosyltransferase family 1 protein [Streptomyces sp. 8K308]
MRKALLVSHRLGGLDGVSVAAERWVSVLSQLDFRVTRVASHYVRQEPDDLLIRGMWADLPGHPCPPLDMAAARELVRQSDLVVLDNLGTLPSAPDAALSWQEILLQEGVPTIVRHHDPGWQIVSGMWGAYDPASGLPLHHPRMLHVTINGITMRDFAQRYPKLLESGSLVTVYNTVDGQELLDGDRARTRAELNVADEDLLVLHPTMLAKRKNIPAAVELCRRLQRFYGELRRVRYWITHTSAKWDQSLPSEIEESFAVAPGLVVGSTPRRSDMYAAADLVVLTSIWEGFGQPVPEAMVAGKPVAAGPYPVLEELVDRHRWKVLDPLDPEAVFETLGDVERLREIVSWNRGRAEKLDTSNLVSPMRTLVRAAEDLANGRTGIRAADSDLMISATRSVGEEGGPADRSGFSRVP